MFLKNMRIRNGESYTDISIFECDSCSKEISESDNHYTDGAGMHLCTECAFKHGKIDDKRYLRECGIHLDSYHAAVYEGEIVMWTGKKPPWEKTDRDYRMSADYRNWRKEVFERDNYNCQICGKKGGELNAHHIKTFKKHKKLRFEVSNGVTLCAKCHREVHKGGECDGSKANVFIKSN